MKKVKNISDQTLAIPGVGRVEPGKTIDVGDEFNNPNFVNVSHETKSKENTEETGSKKADKSQFKS